MSTRNEPFAPGTPCWVDLASSDVAASTAFYAGVFGWVPEDMGENFGHYVNFRSDGHQVAGLMGIATDSPAVDAWNTYISTADIAASLNTAAMAGGVVVVPSMQVADLGSMAVLSDTSGGVFGLWQAARHIGFEKYNEPGSVTWDEYHSKDFPATLKFYGSVFDWDIEAMSDTDEFRYFQAKIDGETVAGLMDSKSFLPPQVPSHWAIYFSVADADETLAKIVDLGGSVIRPAEDTSFGRIADATDSTGAPFKIHSVKMASA